MVAEREGGVGLLVLVGLAVVVVLGLPLVGDAPSADEPPEKLLDEAIEAVESEPIEGVRTDTVERAGEREQVTVAVKEQPPGQSVIDVLETTQPDETMDKTVINGSHQWQYDEDDSRVLYLEADGYWRSDTFTFRTDTRQVRNTYEAAYTGIESVADRETHVVELTPPDSAAELSLDIQTGESQYTVPLYEVGQESWHLETERWWIDTETSYPVKQQLEWTDESGEWVATTTREYEELTVGAEHDDGTFTFEPPENAVVDEPNIVDSEEYESRDAAAEVVPYAVPDPDVPSGYQLDKIRVQTPDDWTSVLLSYLDGRETVNVYVTDGDLFVDEDDVIDRDVGDIDGDVHMTRGQPHLVWECGELTYRTNGPLDVDVLVELAESIDC